MPTVLMMHRLSDFVITLGQGRWVLVKLCPFETHTAACQCLYGYPENLPPGVALVVACRGELPEAANLCAAAWDTYVLMRGMSQISIWDHSPTAEQVAEAMANNVCTARFA